MQELGKGERIAMKLLCQILGFPLRAIVFVGYFVIIFTGSLLFGWDYQSDEAIHNSFEWMVTGERR